MWEFLPRVVVIIIRFLLLWLKLDMVFVIGMVAVSGSVGDFLIRHFTILEPLPLFSVGGFNLAFPVGIVDLPDFLGSHVLVKFPDVWELQRLLVAPPDHLRGPAEKDLGEEARIGLWTSPLIQDVLHFRF